MRGKGERNEGRGSGTLTEDFLWVVKLELLVKALLLPGETAACKQSHQE